MAKLRLRREVPDSRAPIVGPRGDNAADVLAEARVMVDVLAEN